MVMTLPLTRPLGELLDPLRATRPHLLIERFAWEICKTLSSSHLVLACWALPDAVGRRGGLFPEFCGLENDFKDFTYYLHVRFIPSSHLKEGGISQTC